MTETGTMADERQLAFRLFSMRILIVNQFLRRAAGTARMPVAKQRGRKAEGNVAVQHRLNVAERRCPRILLN